MLYQSLYNCEYNVCVNGEWIMRVNKIRLNLTNNKKINISKVLFET